MRQTGARNPCPPCRHFFITCVAVPAVGSGTKNNLLSLNASHVISRRSQLASTLLILTCNSHHQSLYCLPAPQDIQLQRRESPRTTRCHVVSPPFQLEGCGPAFRQRSGLTRRWTMGGMLKRRARSPRQPIIRPQYRQTQHRAAAAPPARRRRAAAPTSAAVTTSRECHDAQSNTQAAAAAGAREPSPPVDFNVNSTSKQRLPAPVPAAWPWSPS
ncbi:hypothetical protein GALMADRAFT_1174371 [Galerina marginata CBS 339.88]|uniref:Uncharacterized protein n=1 Tax=Galerina marginata (strain CBS 339.88) TaxID=685588 RepID=A0A067TJD6_GALM3|nr:hypothetical protein GALMADRAFT_1174371 [Galerina marginata CBS 339.88]